MAHKSNNIRNGQHKSSTWVEYYRLLNTDVFKVESW